MMGRDDITTMRIAYADPPYIGQAKKHYGSEEVDHQGGTYEVHLPFRGACDVSRTIAI